MSDETTGTATPSDDAAASRYVVTPAPEDVEKSGATAPAEARGAVKPETLPTDTYVVTAPTAEASDDATATAVLPPAQDPATEVIAPSAGPQIVYVERPAPPKKLSNRPIGVLVVVLATVLFAVLASFTVLIVMRVSTGVAVLSDLANPGYWIPVLLFLVAFLLAVLIVNRAGVWAHIVASVAVGAIVYFGTAFIVALIEVVLYRHEVALAEALASPVTIVAGLLAREIALWGGVILGRRGRTLAARNAAARAEYERALAEGRAS